MAGVVAYLGYRLHRQKKDLQDLLNFIVTEKKRVGPATRNLMDLLSDIANASAESGENHYLLAKRLHHILLSPRGEGRSIKGDYLYLADLYNEGLLTWLRKEYPDLTSNEVVLCAMLTLGLEPPCISKVLGYDHEHTFYNKRAEIRKKLRLDHNDPLEGFLAGQAERLEQQHKAFIRQLTERY